MANRSDPTSTNEASEDAMAAVAFTRGGVWLGARLALPLALGTAPYGMVYGALARQAGMGAAETVLMSALVCAGAAQFVVLDLWTAPLPVGTLIVTVLVVNARHLLMGAALSPWFGRIPKPAAYASLFFLFDESWALTNRTFERGGRDAAVLLGSGVTPALAWVGSTAVGQAIGFALGETAGRELGVAFVAVFAALLAGTWDGAGRVLPWAVGGGVALMAERWLGGGWYVLAGGVAGSLIGAMRDGD